MRLFVAIQPDAATRAWLAAAQERLRKGLGRFGRELRWVDPGAIHVTMAFVGEAPAVAPIAEALEGCRCVPMDLRVEGLGVFPNARRPSVLWVGVTDASGELARLQVEVAAALAPFVEPERRRFEPHLTLARMGRPHAALGAAITALAAGWGGAPQPWHVQSFALMQSQLDSNGARHSVVRVFGRNERERRHPAGTRFPLWKGQHGMSRERWEHFSHKADIGVRGFGATKEQAFEQAARAAVAVIADVEAVRGEEAIEVACEAPDDELLLVDWLNAVVFEIAVRKMLFSRFAIQIDGHRLHARLWGEKIDLDRHQPCVEIKGATCTETRVFRRKDGTWVAQCVVDV
ncbi:MAG: RNA 2',3'-cyclic phosphodiesterase [Verrucomicrobiota bacterium]